MTNGIFPLPWSFLDPPLFTLLQNKRITNWPSYTYRRALLLEICFPRILFPILTFSSLSPVSIKDSRKYIICKDTAFEMYYNVRLNTTTAHTHTHTHYTQLIMHSIKLTKFIVILKAILISKTLIWSIEAELLYPPFGYHCAKITHSSDNYWSLITNILLYD